MASSRDIVFYHYTFSPYARRVVYYLNFRNIPYTQCLQPPILPRPDVAELGIAYRRIPLMAIGRDVYLDSRLIIAKLEELFPPSSEHPPLVIASPDGKALIGLLNRWVVDGGVFARAAQLIPTDSPVMRDDKFTKDREQLSGASWSAATMQRNRPEALVEMRNVFEFLETTMLKDGREWIFRTDAPTLADIEAIWPFVWLQGMKGSMPAEYISAQQFPKVFAWMDRFTQASKAASKKAGKPVTLTGPEAASKVTSAEYAEALGSVDTSDPSGLSSGQEIELWPTDSGFNNKDRGNLLALSPAEIVIEVKTKSGESVRVHAPRHGFRFRALQDGKTAKL